MAVADIGCRLIVASAIARILHCLHDNDGRTVSSGCPGMTAHLRREHDRVTAEIAQLQGSRQVLETMLAVGSELPPA
ncbi:hypothetical protein LO772_00315 [Yinghuangia sp. ASG 101]|uniref:hypothetical protein n=1 Tax=Yinghuangia sp. ASG 101 TaxID=2896848 RepID=UPI001E58C600|nr:hypothetical protein [Yinghuangia sp. ASG 101]UGQ12095.1 hypothetical protein LO772_00315 [Yinghuangia sp. ASG 101]